MSDLARQAAGLIANVSGSRGRIPIGMTVEILNSVGVLVSHEDAAWLALARCPDPLTLEAAVQVMGREPDETFPRGYRGRWDWGETTSLRVFPNGNRTLRFGGNEYDNPTIGQFACLVAASRMGESK